MKNLRNYNIKGFTLIEMMVVITIIMIFAGTTVNAGWHSLRETITLRQSGEILKYIVNKAEMDILRDTYRRSTLYYGADYLLIVSEPEGYTLNLTQENLPTCSDEGVTSVSRGELSKKSEKGLLKSVYFSTGGGEDCGVFADADDREWEYQLFYEDEVSPVIKFIHYNPKRDTAPISVTGGAGSYIVIEGADIGKRYYDVNNPSSDSVTLELSDSGGNTAEITIE
ncbi:prepilin-type N-terminal cleavage/methylation domain-containing protein [Patescibacteria group bacterium]|nr:prepilin-type N-terminal cleavage/methylation domain-containing protein [Patescibacteria group bacterium]MBU1682605.1 prepilin-type N-terminal cleavage/methylation domain-containing protein [Patescibacteria group bacterium]